jgi:ribokinase
MSSPSIVVIGSVNVDYQFGCTRLPRAGETVEATWFLESLGGKGANQAVAASRLGAHVTLVARVGLRGDAIVNGLAAEGIDTAYVSVDPTEPTGMASILVDDRGNKSIAVHAGANARLSALDVTNAASAITSAGAVMAQLEVPLDTVRAAFELARHTGALTFLDPAPARPLDDEMLGLVDVIRLNALEAQILTGIEVTDGDSARRAAHRLMVRGVGRVAVQAGEANLLVWSDGEELLPHLDVRCVDATGAGDAFAAALAVGLVEGTSMAQAGAFATAAAALATTAHGAQTALPTREKISRFLTTVP